MAIINYTDQLKYTGKGYLDSKMMPVNTFSDLQNIPRPQRFEGLTITVLNNGNPQDYWLIGGTSNSCWVPKTATNFNDLKLVLEDGFLKLKNADVELGEAVNLNNFFPEGGNSDLYIASVDYVNTDDNGNVGIFMCFTYSDSTKKYLNMSQFLSQTYDAGNGIVINDNVISIDSAITGRIEALEKTVKNFDGDITDLKNRVEALGQKTIDLDSEIAKKANSTDVENLEVAIETINNSINGLNNTLSDATTQIETNKENISKNKVDINVLIERVNALSASAEGSTPDGKTIGITDDEQKALYVKVLNKEGNMLSVENENGESGLCAFIPFYCEDDEINE